MTLNPSEKPFAVVTGASSGIGYELAVQFAQHGYDLLICADGEGIAQAAEDLKILGTNVEYVRCDLSQYKGVDVLVAAIRATGRPVEAIALNAGIGVSGRFAETSLEEEIKLINLNIISTIHLAKHVIQDMLERGQGGKILITSSVAAEAPGPYMAVYNASKAFDQSFALAIREELKNSGITVTALQPDATDTNFFQRAGMLDTKVGQGEKDDPALVAKQGFEALMKGEASIHAGSLGNRIKNAANDMIPEEIKAKQYAKSAKPGSAAGAK